jgi:hypothetical protein
MLDSIGMIKKFVIREALDTQPASVLRVIGIPGDLYDLSIFLMNQDAATGHATLANRPDDLFLHVSPPGKNSDFHHMLFLRDFQCSLRLDARGKKGVHAVRASQGNKMAGSWGTKVRDGRRFHAGSIWESEIETSSEV